MVLQMTFSNIYFEVYKETVVVVIYGDSRSKISKCEIGDTEAPFEF